jgi:O-antigen biosynthesis protein
MSLFPLVTCLCLTRNRREWLPNAIDCFLKQTYEPRELLIVGDGDDVSDLVPVDDRIRLVCVGTRLQVGRKRNYGCGRARGELVAHWDDDDYSGPWRLSDQVGRLLESGKAVTGYHSMKFTNGTRWWEYTVAPGYLLGTSLLYRLDWQQTHPFYDVQPGEDGLFRDEAARCGQVVTAEAGEFMYATIHPGNTSPRVTNAYGWRLLP